MSDIFHLLCKEICKVSFAIHMTNFDKVGRHIPMNSVFPHLNMSQAFSSSGFGPIDTGLIVIINEIGSRHKNILDI